MASRSVLDCSGNYEITSLTVFPGLFTDHVESDTVPAIPVYLFFLFENGSRSLVFFFLFVVVTGVLLPNHPTHAAQEASNLLWNLRTHGSYA